VIGALLLGLVAGVIGIGDDDVVDRGGILLLPFVGIVTRAFGARET
jgi:hypothetical protein